MIAIQSLVGFLLIIIGVIGVFFTGGISLVLVFAGFVLVSLSRISEMVENIQIRGLGIPLTEQQIRAIIKHSKSYFIESKSLGVYPNQETKYTLMLLDGQYYIRAKAFNTYINEVEFEYTFRFPDREPIQIACTDSYYEGVAMFKYGEQTFVKISSLNLQLSIHNDTARLELSAHPSSSI